MKVLQHLIPAITKISNNNNNDDRNGSVIFSLMRLHFVIENSEIYLSNLCCGPGVPFSGLNGSKETDVACQGLVRGTSRAMATQNMALFTGFQESI